MKKLLLIFVVATGSSMSVHAQDSMNKKIDNTTDKMVKKMDNTTDKMNKKIENKPKPTDRKADTLRKKIVPKPRKTEERSDLWFWGINIPDFRSFRGFRMHPPFFKMA